MARRPPGDAALVRALDGALDRLAVPSPRRARRRGALRRVAAAAATSRSSSRCAPAHPRATAPRGRRAPALVAGGGRRARCSPAARRARLARAPGDATAPVEPARPDARTSRPPWDSATRCASPTAAAWCSARRAGSSSPADYGRPARDVDARRGEGWFYVRHDDAHTFTVRAGGATIRDVGTTFTVRTSARAMARVRVAVRSGAVLLGGDGAAGAPDGEGAASCCTRATSAWLQADGRAVADPGACDADDVAWTQRAARLPRGAARRGARRAPRAGTASSCASPRRGQRGRRPPPHGDVRRRVGRPRAARDRARARRRVERRGDTARATLARGRRPVTTRRRTRGALWACCCSRARAATPNDPAEAAACAGAGGARRGTARRWPAPLDRMVAPARRAHAARRARPRSPRRGASGCRTPRSCCRSTARLPARRPRGAAGDALVALLAGTAVAPVVVGVDQVVLVPDARPPTHRASRPPTSDAPGGRRARWGTSSASLVTGSATRARSAPVRATCSTARRWTADGGATRSPPRSTAVPGVWLWSQSPTSLLARYGSMRGASSFGVSAPKIYIDGIEVANPLLVRGIAPETVERVEVIRGPQGAALYGADAISGVIEVVTRHDGVAADAPRSEIRSDAGATAATSAPDVLAQHHALSLRTGTADALGGARRHRRARSATSCRTARAARSRRTATRGVVGRAARSRSPRAARQAAGAHARARCSRGSPRRHCTAGAGSIVATWRRRGEPSGAAYGTTTRRPRTTAASPTAARLATPRRRCSRCAVHVRRDGDARLGRAVDARRRWSASTATGCRRPARRRAVRVRHRLGAPRGARRRGPRSRRACRASAASAPRQHRRHGDARRRALRALRDATCERRRTRGRRAGVGAAAWRSNTGLVAQTRLAVPRRAVRERRRAPGARRGLRHDDTLAALPSLGASLVRPLDVSGGATVTLRAAYGSAIRPARTGSRARRARRSSALAPEPQAGVEVGVDLRSAIRVRAPRDALRPARDGARAAGARVTRAGGRRGGGTRRDAPRGAGERGRDREPRLGAAGSAARRARRPALVRRRALARRQPRGARGRLRGHRSDLRAGDRMLDVPARTATLSRGWTAPRWSASTGLARASDWVDYDRLALARDLASGAVHAAAGGHAAPRLLAHVRRRDAPPRERVAGAAPRIRADARGRQSVGSAARRAGRRDGGAGADDHVRRAGEVLRRPVGAPSHISSREKTRRVWIADRTIE